MTTLQTVSGIAARIFELPDRPPFMVAADLAEAYGTEPKYINRAVLRNPTRFPEDFAFRLTEAEAAVMHERWSQIGTTSAGQRTDLRPLVFTHAGAVALSGVLKTEVAAEVSVIVHRAYAALEQNAIRETQMLLAKLRMEASFNRHRLRVVELSKAGYDFEKLWAAGSLSKPRLALVVAECVRLGLIPQAPAGTPESQQPDLFSE